MASEKIVWEDFGRVFSNSRFGLFRCSSRLGIYQTSRFVGTSTRNCWLYPVSHRRKYRPMKRSYRETESGWTQKPGLRKNAGGGKRKRRMFRTKEDAELDRKERMGLRVKRKGLNG